MLGVASADFKDSEVLDADKGIESTIVVTDLKSFRGDKITQAFQIKLFLSSTQFLRLSIREELVRTDRSHLFFMLNEQVYYDERVYRTSKPNYFQEIAERAYSKLVKVYAKNLINRNL